MGKFISKQYVECYNCAIPYPIHDSHFGCILCRRYGDGKGRIEKRYMNKCIFFTENNIRYCFYPFPFLCLWCKDTLKTTYPIWHDEDLKYVEVTCHKCDEDTHLKEFGKAVLDFNMAVHALSIIPKNLRIL